MMKPLGVQYCERKKYLDLGPGKTHMHMLNLTAESSLGSEVKCGCKYSTMIFSVSVVLLVAVGQLST